MEERNTETKTQGKRLLLEVIISDEGEATLAGTGFPVKITKPLGVPRKMNLVDYSTESGDDMDVFARRLEKIYELAPKRANAFATPHQWKDSEIHSGGGDDIIHESQVQFYELNKASLEEALRYSGLI